MDRKLKEEVEKKSLFKKEVEASVLMKQEQLMMERMKDEEDEKLNRKYNEEKEKMNEIFKIQRRGKDEAREQVQKQVSCEYRHEKLLNEINNKIVLGEQIFVNFAKMLSKLSKELFILSISKLRFISSFML